MCGIFGFAGNPDRAESIDLDVAIRALHHRGPDGNGTYRGRTADTVVVLAHTRLAIIDLSPLAKQPMTTDDGRYTLVYNGEVYNFREIRRELESLGHSFRSASDSEVVLKSYAAWGKQCVERFRGMFALAIWDAKEGSLFFARDRFGIKPFYYRHTAEGFAFASEVRALMKTGCAPKTLSREGLERYFTWGSVADPWTLIDGVLSVIPAHRGLWRNGELTFERYWDFPEGGVRDISFDEAVEELRPILRESIAKELVSDVPLGVFLSGGIDSSAIVAIASQVSPRPIHTFTVTFDEEKYNEAPYAREVAEKFGCVHTEVHLTAEKALAEFENAMASYDQPSADGLNTWFVAKAAREAGLSVALSGLGGDEIFAGYSNFRKFRKFLLTGRIGAPLAGALERLLGSGSFNGTSMRTKKIAELLRAAGDPAATYRAVRCMFTAHQVTRLMTDFDRNVVGSPVTTAASNDLALRLGRESIRLLSQLELTHYVSNTLLRDSDQMSMAHSLEVRVPLLDHVIIEAVLPLSSGVKLMAPGRSSVPNKPLLVAASSHIPDSTLLRTKAGFVLPFTNWLQNASIGGGHPYESVGVAMRELSSDGRSASRLLSLAAISRWIADAS